MKADFFNKGVYSIREVSRLTNVSVGRIRRWVRGYRYRWRGRVYTSEALWHGQWEPLHDHLALGFLDVIEIRFVEAFLKSGVTWATLRQARERAREEFQVSHPFCSNRFVTDGRELLVEMHRESHEPSLMDMVRRQQVFAQTIKPCVEDMEVGPDGMVARWWPLGKERLVVIDPALNLGWPIVAQHGVPTEVAAKAAAGTSVREAARWFDAPEAGIRDAIEYEQRLAA